MIDLWAFGLPGMKRYRTLELRGILPSYIEEKESKHFLVLNVAGIKKEDIKVKVRKNVLKVETKIGEEERIREYELPSERCRVKSVWDNGLLKIDIEEEEGEEIEVEIL